MLLLNILHAFVILPALVLLAMKLIKNEPIPKDFIYVLGAVAAVGIVFHLYKIGVFVQTYGISALFKTSNLIA